MPYASLLVYVNDKPKQMVRIAASLASKFGASLIGVSASPIPPPAVANGIVAVLPTEEDIKRMSAKLAEEGDWFRGIAGDHRKPEWRQFLEFPVDVLSREARSADLVIIGKAERRFGEYGFIDPGEAILRMGRPTLVVPKGVGRLQAEHVVIGWKDVREARRAVFDALPFLQEATRVSIAELCAPNEEKATLERLDDVMRYLTWHRIKGGVRVMLEKEGSGAAQLIRLAQDEEADLLVTGAYGHSRLGEWIFGGMTRDLLATSPICCFMSH
jgi:nucleotide-binding universal stress UspA family protein